MEMILLVGIQGSGKTTFFRERFFDTHVRVSLDMLRTRERERILIAACLMAQQPLVIDNTNTLASERAGYIEMARNAGFQTVGVGFTGTGLRLKFTLTGANAYTLLTIDNATTTTNRNATTIVISAAARGINSRWNRSRSLRNSHPTRIVAAKVPSPHGSPLRSLKIRPSSAGANMP